MSAQTRTLADFIEEHGLTADVDWADTNPNMADMPAGSTHWTVTIRNGPRSMQVPFSMGPAHTAEPSLADVLDCVASDSANVDNAQSFDDWAQDLGYFPMESSEDYQRARRTWDACREQALHLHNVLGESAYEDLLWNVERQ